MYRHPSVQYIQFRSAIRTKQVIQFPSLTALIGMLFFLPSQGSQTPAPTFEFETVHNTLPSTPLKATAYVQPITLASPCEALQD